MHARLNNRRGITLVGLIVTIIVLLILAGITILALNGENGLLSKAKLAKNKYEISEVKEKLEFAITELRIEEEKEDSLTKEDLIKLNNDKIDVKSTESFPVEIIYEKYKFSVDEYFIISYIGEANETIITYTTTPEGYTNQDSIKLTLKISNPKGIKTVEFPDGGIVECFGNKEYAKDFKEIVNGTYTYKATDIDGNETTKEILIDKIDKLEPKDFTPEIQKAGGTITIKENGDDAEADGTSSKSGIAYYEYYIIDENNVTTQYETNQIENLALGTYKVYVIAYDRAGNSKKSSEIEFKISTQFLYVSAGEFHSLAMDSEGTIRSWGRNNYYQLALYAPGTNDIINYPSQIYTKIKFNQIETRKNHSLAIDKEGKLWVWGWNKYGQLGTGKSGDNAYKKYPVQIKEETKFKQVSAGEYHSLAIDIEGNLWAWGSNSSGKLGDGTVTNRLSPVQIKEGTKFSQVSAGYQHSLAIDEEGNLWAWGSNGYGQLGDGTTTDKTSPVQIATGTKFSQVSAGQLHSLAIDSEGNLWAWGYNGDGRLGDGTLGNRTSPVQIKAGTKFSQVSAGWEHSLAIDSEGNLWVWGRQDCGRLGTNTSENETSPVQIATGTKFSQVSAGYQHSLAIDGEGNLWSWGSRYYGQLGDGVTNYGANGKPTQINIK